MAAPLPTPQTNIYGTNASDAVNYGQIIRVAGNPVTANDYQLIFAAINQERQRRGVGAVPTTPTPFDGLIEAQDLNDLKQYVEVAGPTPNPPSWTYNAGGAEERPPIGTSFFPVAPAFTGGFQGVRAERNIFAAEINSLVQKVNSAGAVCVCNCNYCTCNCNYCTCNCNYSCTCNCNYSDERLKTNIEFVRTQDGLNVYSWSYLWDTTRTYVGVLAQELLGTKFASALQQDTNGYYMVDYSKLPVKMIEG